jgi:hypothetical protein
MNSDNRLKKIIENLETKIPEINPGDFRFYNLAHIPLIAKKTIDNHKICPICDSNIHIIAEIVDLLPDVLAQDAKNRKLFEIKKNKIEKHLKKKHRCQFPGYYTALGSLVGLVIGIFISIFIAILYKLPMLNKLSTTVLAILLITGRFVGIFLDKKVFHKNLQL